MSKLHPLEVVSRGSETQLQVGEDHLVGKRLMEMVNKWHSHSLHIVMFVQEVSTN